MAYKCPECGHTELFQRTDTDVASGTWLIGPSGEAIDKLKSDHFDTLEYGTEITCNECLHEGPEDTFDPDLDFEEDDDEN